MSEEALNPEQFAHIETLVETGVLKVPLVARLVATVNAHKRERLFFSRMKACKWFSIGVLLEVACQELLRLVWG